jgi:hypothetical protein
VVVDCVILVPNYGWPSTVRPASGHRRLPTHVFTGAGQGKEVARLLGQCWPLEDARRRTRRCSRALPAAEQAHTRQEARRGRRPLDAKPTRASRPHRLVVACSRLIRTRAIPKDGAARAAATDVTGAHRVRAGATGDRLFDVGTWTPLRFKGLGCSTPPCRRVPTTHHGGRRRCIGAGHGGSVVGGGLGGGGMDTLRLALYL